ncbi:MAG: hypothetical protein DHS80DRAFT_25786 [Piptocephalis tieghemiana]|nr:MAG: hypothetical protein DHS80DRAFT_25786 [Piptocephalis tieghemiana]
MPVSIASHLISLLLLLHFLAPISLVQPVPLFNRKSKGEPGDVDFFQDFHLEGDGESSFYRGHQSSVRPKKNRKTGHDKHQTINSLDTKKKKSHFKTAAMAGLGIGVGVSLAAVAGSALYTKLGETGGHYDVTYASKEDKDSSDKSSKDSLKDTTDDLLGEGKGSKGDDDSFGDLFDDKDSLGGKDSWDNKNSLDDKDSLGGKDSWDNKGSLDDKDSFEDKDSWDSKSSLDDKKSLKDKDPFMWKDKESVNESRDSSTSSEPRKPSSVDDPKSSKSALLDELAEDPFTSSRSPRDGNDQNSSSFKDIGSNKETNNDFLSTSSSTSSGKLGDNHSDPFEFHDVKGESEHADLALNPPRSIGREEQIVLGASASPPPEAPSFTDELSLMVPAVGMVSMTSTNGLGETVRREQARHGHESQGASIPVWTKSGPGSYSAYRALHGPAPVRSAGPGTSIPFHGNFHDPNATLLLEDEEEGSKPEGRSIGISRPSSLGSLGGPRINDNPSALSLGTRPELFIPPMGQDDPGHKDSLKTLRTKQSTQDRLEDDPFS